MVKRTRRRRRHEEDEVKSKKSQEYEEAEDQEEEDDYEDEVFTGKDVKRALEDPFRPPCLGDFELKVKGVKNYPPEDDRMGNYTVTFDIIDGPEDEPEDGWPVVKERFARRYKRGVKLTDGQKGMVHMSKADTFRFITACLGELDEDEKYTYGELLKECKGQHVLVTAVASRDGQYKNWRNWRPATDEEDED